MIDLEGSGPLVYNVNDLEVVHKVVDLLLEVTNDKTPVNSYNKREEAKFKKILESIE